MKNKWVLFAISFIPFLSVKQDGSVRFSFGNLALQSMTVILVCGLYAKWFTMKNIESADILGIAGLVFGTGYLTNQHKKQETGKQSPNKEE